MDQIICPGCGMRVEPILIFDRSPRTRKPYLITQCPRERCKFNIDINEYTGRAARDADDHKKGDSGGEGKSFWKSGL